jgi:hypothetical protein
MPNALGDFASEKSKTNLTKPLERFSRRNGITATRSTPRVSFNPNSQLAISSPAIDSFTLCHRWLFTTNGLIHNRNRRLSPRISEIRNNNDARDPSVHAPLSSGTDQPPSIHSVINNCAFLIDVSPLLRGGNTNEPYPNTQKVKAPCIKTRVRRHPRGRLLHLRVAY